MRSPSEVVATEESFLKYQDRIRRNIFSLVRNRAEAEDLTQETLLRALGAEGSVRDPKAVRGWLYRIATNLCVDRLRQRKPQVSIDSNEGAAHVKLVASATHRPQRSPSGTKRAHAYTDVWIFCLTPIAL